VSILDQPSTMTARVADAAALGRENGKRLAGIVGPLEKNVREWQAVVGSKNPEDMLVGVYVRSFAKTWWDYTP
jgi:hypothetical protein